MMSYILQWILVGLTVAAAVVFLVRRLSKPKSACGCGDCTRCDCGGEFDSACSEAIRPGGLKRP